MKIVLTLQHPLKGPQGCPGSVFHTLGTSGQVHSDQYSIWYSCLITVTILQFRGSMETFPPFIVVFFFFFLPFLWPQLQHTEIPRVGRGWLELQPPPYTTATATPDPSCLCDLHHSSWQHRILNPLVVARDWTWIFMDIRFISTAPQWKLFLYISLSSSINNCF